MDKKYNIFYLAETQCNTKICQYLSLDNFLTHLKRRQYYIRRKNLFEDVNEKTLPMKLLFKPTVAFPNKTLSTEEKNSLIKSIKAQSEKLTQYKELSNCFVSSWTLNTDYNYLMWDTYASRFGVCIISTIFNVIASFRNKDFQEYNVYSAPIYYREPTYCDEPGDLVFVKRPLYRMESELRFLFKPKNKEISSKENIWFPYDPEVMIDEVILSPYWSSSTSLFIKECLENKFGLKVKTSNEVKHTNLLKIPILTL